MKDYTELYRKEYEAKQRAKEIIYGSGRDIYKENDELKKRIKELEEELEALKRMK